MSVDRFNDPFLLVGIDADRLKRLSGAAARADERFVVRARQRRMTVAEPSAQRADRRSDDVILHWHTIPCICDKPKSARFCRN